MENSERYERGIAMRSRALGQGDIAKETQEADDCGRRLQRMELEFEWGEVWAGTGLDLRLRSLCAVAILAAQGNVRQLKTYMRGALGNGVTKEEIREVLLHVRIYAGAALNRQAAEVLAAVLAEQPH